MKPSERILQIATTREAANHPPYSALIVTPSLMDVLDYLDEEKLSAERGGGSARLSPCQVCGGSGRCSTCKPSEDVDRPSPDAVRCAACLGELEEAKLDPRFIGRYFLPCKWHDSKSRSEAPVEETFREAAKVRDAQRLRERERLDADEARERSEAPDPGQAEAGGPSDSDLRSIFIKAAQLYDDPNLREREGNRALFNAGSGASEARLVDIRSLESERSRQAAHIGALESELGEAKAKVAAWEPVVREACIERYVELRTGVAALPLGIRGVVDALPSTEISGVTRPTR